MFFCTSSSVLKCFYHIVVSFARGYVGLGSCPLFKSCGGCFWQVRFLSPPKIISYWHLVVVQVVLAGLGALFTPFSKPCVSNYMGFVTNFKVNLQDNR